MVAPTARVSEMLRGLRHFYAISRPVLGGLAHQRPWCVPSCRDNPTMAEPASVWKTRAAHMARRILDFVWVCAVYLASELIIWGLSRALAPANLEFFSSICGMALTFAFMAGLCAWSPNIDGIYQRHVKPKIDFINSHLGLGFPIPLVMLNKSEILEAYEIARIIGNFLLTNIASWTFVFILSLFVMTIVTNATYRISQGIFNSTAIPERQHGADAMWTSESILEQGIDSPATDCEKSIYNTALSADPSFELAQRLPTTPETMVSSLAWKFCTSYFTLICAFFSIFIIGVPVAAAAKEERIIDGSVLWFVWVLAITIQQGIRSSNCGSLSPELKNALVTLMNPVLMTTLLMIAYIRAKAAVYGEGSFLDILNIFSSGTSLYALWTSKLTSTPLLHGATDWFGAGDAALSILECGILIWGFKLYECQNQLFSTAGVFTIAISIISAAANVFLCVLSGRAIGLQKEEALAFAARSTTLALAKPAMEAIGGSLGANAALVVSNGILGQLIYPFVLDRLGVKSGDDGATQCSPECDTTSPKLKAEDLEGKDSPIIIAAGIAIGINGAAMGVSYLYETKSRSAPYAALAMTVFGIMTVILTTVEPFQSVVVGLATS